MLSEHVDIHRTVSVVLATMMVLHTENMDICSLAFSFIFRERNPISTRTELACLGLTGIFWLSKLYHSLFKAFR